MGIAMLPAEHAKLSKLSDDQLLLRIYAKKDGDAFEEFYGRHHRHAFNLACRLVPSRQLAEESVQEAFLDIWRGTGRPSEGKARPWLFGVVARKCFKRKLYPREKKPESGDLESLAPSVHRQDQEDMEHSELQNQLRVLLAKLPQKEQQLLAMYYSGGMAQLEIARITGIPQRTVSSKLLKLLNDLRSNLAKAGFSETLPAADAIRQVWSLDAALPPHLSAKMWQALLRSTKEAGSGFQLVGRARAAPRIFFWVALVLVMVALAGAASAFWMKTGETFLGASIDPAAETSPTEPANASTVPALESGRLSRTWTFEKGLPKEMLPVEGDFDIWPATPLRPAVLACSPHAENTFLLSVPLSKGPLLATMEAHTLNCQNWASSILFARDFQIPVRQSLFENNLLPEEWDKTLRCRIYAFDGRVAIMAHGRVLSHTFYQRIFAPHQLLLSIKGLYLRKVSLQEIDASEIPAALRRSREKVLEGKAVGRVTFEARTIPQPRSWVGAKPMRMDWDFRTNKEASAAFVRNGFRWREPTSTRSGALVYTRDNEKFKATLPAKLSVRPFLVTMLGQIVNREFPMWYAASYKEILKQSAVLHKSLKKGVNVGDTVKLQWYGDREYVCMIVNGAPVFMLRYAHPVPGMGFVLALQNCGMERITVQEFERDSVPQVLSKVVAHIEGWERELSNKP